jgi:DNA-binding response OmpR family regulator
MNKVLIVNHSEDTMELMKMWLNKKGFEVKCTNQEEAFPLLLEFKPNVVIVDALQHEVAERIKQEEKLSDIPVIVMTGNVKNRYNLMADDTISKPFNPTELELKIQKFLKKTG